MDTEKVRLNITLPVAVAKELNRLTAPRKRSQFVADAIMLQVRKLEKEKLNAFLAEGYTAEKRHGEKITREFEPADMEGWHDY